MASALTEAHIVAQARLRVIVERAIRAAWVGLAGYDEDDVEPFIDAVAPMVAAGMRRSVALTDAYMARALGRTPFGIDPNEVLAQVRPGIEPQQEWRRPFVTLWSALGSGTPYEQAVRNGLLRAVDLGTTDVQLAHRGALQAVQDRAPGSIYGFQRVADGNACSYCKMLSGAYVKNAGAMPMHPGCGCGLEPLTRPHRLAARLPSGVAVHQHGELGPVVGASTHDFTQL